MFDLTPLLSNEVLGKRTITIAKQDFNSNTIKYLAISLGASLPFAFLAAQVIGDIGWSILLIGMMLGYFLFLNKDRHSKTSNFLLIRQKYKTKKNSQKFACLTSEVPIQVNLHTQCTFSFLGVLPKRDYIAFS
jgi:hypothetical protein